MDFTYFVALALSALFGFIVAAALVAAGKAPTLKHYRTTVFSMMAIDYLVLINWPAVTFQESWILAVDFVFFTIYGVIGVAIGMFPVIAARAIIQRLRR